jgi:alkylated DNA repair dioxygenase AlkB
MKLITSLPPAIRIQENFVTEAKAQEILSNIQRNKKRETYLRNSIRRYGSALPYKDDVISEKIPEFLNELSEKLKREGLLDVLPDSVTINEYFKGQRIGYHIDSQRSGNTISVLSLISDCVMKFRRVIDGNLKVYDITLPKNSLMQMHGPIRWQWEHGIEPLSEDRISIVFRKST